MMTPRAALAIAAAGAGAWIVIGLLALLAFALSGCATVRTPRGIAATLDRCLTEQAPRLRAQGERPLVLRCACVSDAERACRKAGLPAGCAWDGWVDLDRDGWTIAACRERAASGL